MNRADFRVYMRACHTELNFPVLRGNATSFPKITEKSDSHSSLSRTCENQNRSSRRTCYNQTWRHKLGLVTTGHGSSRRTCYNQTWWHQLGLVTTRHGSLRNDLAICTKQTELCKWELLELGKALQVWLDYIVSRSSSNSTLYNQTYFWFLKCDLVIKWKHCSLGRTCYNRTQLSWWVSITHKSLRKPAKCKLAQTCPKGFLSFPNPISRLSLHGR